MPMLKEILRLQRGRVLITGGAKRLTAIYLRDWTENGEAIANALPFPTGAKVRTGDPFTAESRVYFIVNPLSCPKDERQRIAEWLKGKTNALVLLYEEKYVADSITRYAIREAIDYLLAYKRETMGTERIEAMKLENGRITARKTYLRRAREPRE